MAYTGKKPVDHTDVTQSQSMTVTDDLTVDTSTLKVDSTNNRVGIGTTSPDAIGLHVHTGSAGTLTPNSAADDLVVESNGNAGITIASPDANYSGIIFSSPTDTTGSIIEYNQSGATFDIGTATSGGVLRLRSGSFTEAMRIDSSGNVEIGSSLTDGKLGVHGDALNFSPSADSSSNGIGCCILGSNVADAGAASARLYMSGANSAHAGNLDLRSGSVIESTLNMYAVSGTKTVFLTTNGDSYINSGKFGIGTTSPTSLLDVQGEADANDVMIDVTNTKYNSLNTSGESKIRFGWGNHVAANIAAYKENTNRTGFKITTELGFNVARVAATIDADGDVFLGEKTTISDTDTGHTFARGGLAYHTTNGTLTMSLKRETSEGDILRFVGPSAHAGFIGVDNADNLYIQGTTTAGGLQFGDGGGGGNVLPHKNGADVDNTIDLGSSSRRFDDIYATNGTIQTSDQNEKQQIASLTAAEITAAKAISKLFKTFKWNDKVEAKGDAARTHTGVIAQDVQQAMTDAGLDAGDYAFFISTTWWETQTEVPAVEAVEAQDAVYDEDGNLVTEAVEAVEAKDAYTRTDTYETDEEAPEGATERTRLGIRYPELLAFIGAATEQRLADIETRLTALEN